MSFFFRLLAAGAAICCCQIALAGDVKIGKVVYAGTYGNGHIFVALDSTIDEPGCPQVRFDVPASHPQAKTWLAVALAALASGRSVAVQTSGCLGTLPTMSQDESTFFYMQ